MSGKRGKHKSSGSHRGGSRSRIAEVADAVPTSTSTQSNLANDEVKDPAPRGYAVTEEEEEEGEETSEVTTVFSLPSRTPVLDSVPGGVVVLGEEEEEEEEEEGASLATMASATATTTTTTTTAATTTTTAAAAAAKTAVRAPIHCPSPLKARMAREKTDDTSMPGAENEELLSDSQKRFRRAYIGLRTTAAMRVHEILRDLHGELTNVSGALGKTLGVVQDVSHSLRMNCTDLSNLSRDLRTFDLL